MLELSRIRAGIWEGVIVAPKAPEIELVHLERVLPGLEIGGGEGKWQVSVPIPAAILSDGVQTILIRDVAAGETIGRVSIVAGQPLDEDLRAEIDLLRAELDLLKRAFRRHCVEILG
ncbi:hypothetical protein RYZ20_09765 [Thioclava sp. A2]|uniref:hypothetical protein n=1 Tax=Thioclava sp. FCG-A2 TaxID=3080562 RepID=UPI0029551A41|nr:hypothetical protein [Thioclava sp. A2]MDV7271187.1 hypothetical protein [Thioclava sp. A2]